VKEEHPKPEQLIDAAALVIVDAQYRSILLAQRNPKLKFLGGFHAFPGGKCESGDNEIEVANSPEKETSRLIVCAVRETFEETGLLLLRGGDKLTKGQRASLHDDLVSKRSSFKEILDDWGLWIDAADFHDAGVWITPKFSQLRFKTRFFFAVCPSKQSPYDAIDELCSCRFVTPSDALDEWRSKGVLMSPPVFIAFETSAEEADESGIRIQVAAESLKQRSQVTDGLITDVRVNPHIRVIPLETKTLPPATHTNCFIVGHRKFVVIDAASPYPAEQKRINNLVGDLIEQGGECQAIITSHLHPDHFGGEGSLKQYIFERFGTVTPLTTHKLTASALEDKITFTHLVEDGEVFQLEDEYGDGFELMVLHTPGHAKGHLCFYDHQKGFLITCDNVLSNGTVVIAPPEGDMAEYLASLKRLIELPGLRSLCGSHGTAVFDAKTKISQNISHRHYRERQILSLMKAGKFEDEILETIYEGLGSDLLPLARKTIQAHMFKINAEGLI
jgi:endoribonuclease LACTB2